MKALALSALLCLTFLCLASTSQAFTHVVRKGDTLASIAETYYGRIQYEKLLVAANSLDAHGGTSIVPGMRLEVPAVSYRRVLKGETWASLAEQHLGSGERGEPLAVANGTYPWLPPSEGAQVMIPYNLRIIAGPADSIVSLSYEYLGDKKHAYMLDRYNKLKAGKVRPGDVLLIPLTDLPLTSAGKAAVAAAAELRCSEAGGEVRVAQRSVESELPMLIADVRGARYVSAITRGTRFLASGQLTRNQLATIHRQLLEAYAALDAVGLAASSCDAWRQHEPAARVDETALSPKLLAACQHGTAKP
jgi:hypothetical protein